MNSADFTRLVALAQEPIDSPWLDSLWEQVKAYTSERINYYRFLYHLVKETRPEVSIELGVEFGLASAHMALAAKEYGGIVIGIDLNGHDIPAKQIPAMYANYRFLTGDSTSPYIHAGAMWIIRERNVGLVFQDSSHHYAPSVAEWEIYTQFCKPGALWVCDDLLPCFFEAGVDEKAMDAYFAERPAQAKYWFPDVLHHGNTIGVMVL